jgi:signal transduction histidine kinase
MLAPLGWLGLSAIGPQQQVANCLAVPSARLSPEELELQGLSDPALLARRLARQWGLPNWLQGVIGQLDMPIDLIRRQGADPHLFALTRLAAHLAAESGHDLGLVQAPDLSEEQHLTGLNRADLPVESLLEEARAIPTPTLAAPYGIDLLPQLLELAIVNRELHNQPRHDQLEREVENLHLALRQQVRGEAERLHSAKLASLAELAAGAGHEINNPLAVISGQAQYLLGHQADLLVADTEGAVSKVLHTIIGQTKRIHSLIRELMLFARPVPARLTKVDLPTLLGEVSASLVELAEKKRVQLAVFARPEQLPILTDAEQVRTVLTNLLRNAIEAAPLDGWARLVMHEGRNPDEIEVFVEDSGPGPTPEQQPHLFDPFYSGRSAGRGRGLGLPVAWRLARNQGGDVSLAARRAGQPTRFVVTIPRGRPSAAEDEQVEETSPNGLSAA